MDWQETLERAIPQPPPTQPDPAALVADGKRLVRRRRLAVVAGSAAAVALVIGIGAVVVPSRDSATPDPPIATRSTGEEWPPEVDIPLSDLAPVAYDFDTGETTFQEGWTEVDRVGALTSSDSLAVAVTDGEKTIYAYFPQREDAAFADASHTAKDFRTWARELPDHQPDVMWDPGDRLSVGGSGWKIVREISNPFGYDAPWDSVGAVIEREGVEKWLFLRNSRTALSLAPDGGSIYAIPGQSIDGWLTRIERSDRATYRPNYRNLVEPAITDVVEFSGSEVVPTRDGVVVLDQIADPDINESFTAETSQTAAARITVDGEEQYVLVQEKESATRTKNVSWAFAYNLLPAPYTEDRGPFSLDEFAAIVRRNYGSQGGPWT
ncbi:hypothetical protein OG984_23900 [Nocardioides sp. NBC_00368]|uniref:hypothetical protein n=1 Tax=Nocardioides sp. NBC_00368 TaxID=2976000 RepID=UPI002E1A52A7